MRLDLFFEREFVISAARSCGVKGDNMNTVDPCVAVPGTNIDALPVPRSSSASPNQVLGIVCVGICLANLDLFIVNVGLPNIGRDFRAATLEDLSWILNGYAIAYAALLVFFGRLAERSRRDQSFLLGVGLFTVASAACSAAINVETLIAFRVVQAAGAALMTPTSLGLLLAVFPAERRGSVVRAWTAIGGLAAALGPVVGGLLVTVNWRWIFLVNVPIGLVAMLIGWRKLPQIPGHRAPRPNPLDAAFVTGGIGALATAIIKVNEWGWGSRDVGLSFALAVVLLALFVWRCLRSRNPFVDPALFHTRQFTGAALIMAPYSAALWGQAAWGWSVLKTGLAIAPGPLLVPITSLLVAGRLIAYFGPAAVIAVGIVFFASGMACWATWTGLEPNTALFVLGMILTGIGVGLAFPTLMGVSASGLPSSSFATGSGVINMIRQAALAVGVAIFIAVVGSPASAAERIVAFHRAWWIMVGIVALGLIPAFIFIRPSER
jgi:EmrB/QacA subfamily drug resistance transporter